MGIQALMKSGKFAAAVIALFLVAMPFLIEQVGVQTGMFKFPVTKFVTGLWTAKSADREAKEKPVDWEQYRKDLEAFTRLAETRETVSIFLPSNSVEVFLAKPEKKVVRQLWRVPVTGCAAGKTPESRDGRAFISGYDRVFREGETIAPTKELCGYRIEFIGERSVWFWAIFDPESDCPVCDFNFPVFTRVDGDTLVKGNRRYFVNDAFPLKASGGWLRIHSILPPDGVEFQILDERRYVIATLLAVVIGEKGGR